MDHISLPFSFDQINELLDFCPSEYHFEQHNLFDEKINDPVGTEVPVGLITHNNPPNVEKKLKLSSSSASFRNLEDVNEIKKLIHRDVERQRRQEMATLYRTLRSELPIQCLQGKRSAADHIHETVGYIRQMHKRIEKLKERKEKLMVIKNHGRSSSSSSIISRKEGSKPTRVQVKCSMCTMGIEVLISTDGVVNLSGVLNIVCGEGLSLVNCVSARDRLHSRMLHTLLIQANKGQEERAIELQRKIEDFCNRSMHD